MIYIKSNFSNKLKKYEQTNVVVLLESAFGNDLFSKSVKNTISINKTYLNNKTNICK